MAEKKLKHPADGAFYVTLRMIKDSSLSVCSPALDALNAIFAFNDDRRIPVTLGFLHHMLAVVPGASANWMFETITHLASVEQSREFHMLENSFPPGAIERQLELIMDVLADYAEIPVPKKRTRRYEVALEGFVSATSPEMAAFAAAAEAGVDMIDVRVRPVKGGAQKGTPVYINL